MEEKSIRSQLEVILFACGEPVESSKIATVLDISIKEAEEELDKLDREYEEQGRGLQVLRLAGRYQLATRKEYSPLIKAVMEAKKDTPLSNAAMEVLTIIAYNQPVSKSFVSNVRGVESGNLVNSLVEKELLEEAGRLDVPGKPVAYKTTDNFLRCFGIEGLDELEPLPTHEITGGEDDETADSILTEDPPAEPETDADFSDGDDYEE